jgi:hypothetical protein
VGVAVAVAVAVHKEVVVGLGERNYVQLSRGFVDSRTRYDSMSCRLGGCCHSREEFEWLW